MEFVKQIMQNKPLETLFGNHANQASKQKLAITSSNSATSEENRKRIDRLFLNFAAMYGQVWRSQFKSDSFLDFAKEEWQKGLMGFKETILELAVDVCRDTREFPPTLPQFIDFCKQAFKRDIFFKREELPKINNFEVGEAHLVQIRKMLNMKAN
jgi:hypothetical protein